MALYGSPKYGAEKYGNASYITSTTDAFKTAQAARVRKIYSTLQIQSHIKQYGLDATYAEAAYIGGVPHRRVALKFIAPYSVTLNAVKVMLKGSSTNTDEITLEIQTDNAGEPSGTAVTNASSSIDAVTSITHQWKEFAFDANVSLVAGTTYWIVVWYDVATSETTYLASDDRGGNDEQMYYTYETGIYGTFKYGDGTKYGTDYNDNWTSTSYLLLARLVSATASQNWQNINEMVGWHLVRDKKVPSYSFRARLINRLYRYSYGQVLSDYLEAGKKLRCYIGFEVSGEPVQYLAFIGETNASPASGNTVYLEANCMMKKLIVHKQTWSDLGNTAYETVIQTIANEAGITAYDLRVTGKTSITGVVFQEMSAYAVAEKVRQATIDVMQFKNTETITTAARAKASISEATVPTYVLQDSNFLIAQEIGQNSDNLINRATVTNDEDGETTTDGEPLAVGNYQSLGTASSSLLASEETKVVSVTLSSYPAIYINISDADTDCEIVSVDIDCGTNAVAGSVDITLRNKNYPSSTGDYDLTVKGCPITNAGATTHCGETINWSSWTTYGKNSSRVDNKILASKAEAEGLADNIVDELGLPKDEVKLASRGVVDIYPDDVVRVIESRKTKLNHLVIISSCELDYQKSPARLRMDLVGEKTDYYGS